MFAHKINTFFLLLVTFLARCSQPPAPDDPIRVVYHATELPMKAACLYTGSDESLFELGVLDISRGGGECWVEWNAPTTVTIVAASYTGNEDVPYFECLTTGGSQVEGDGDILCAVRFEEMDGGFTVGTLEGVVKMTFSDGEFDYKKVKKLGYKPSQVTVID